MNKGEEIVSTMAKVEELKLKQELKKVIKQIATDKTIRGKWKALLTLYERLTSTREVSDLVYEIVDYMKSRKLNPHLVLL